MNIAQWLVIGLGNPGERYERTRHNVGFMVADFLVKNHRAEFKEQRSDPAWFEARYTYERESITVLKPLTFMNLSGTAVRKKANFLGIAPGRCIVITDEYNFPVGRIHLRKGGSDGGHNGLTSIIQELNTTEFWRLRCGIGREFGPGGLVDYVLSPFPEAEQVLLGQAVHAAAEAIDTIVRVGAERAMQIVNRVASPQ